MKNFFSGLISLIIVAGVAFGGFLAWDYYKNDAKIFNELFISNDSEDVLDDVVIRPNKPGDDKEDVTDPEEPGDDNTGDNVVTKPELTNDFELSFDGDTESNGLDCVVIENDKTSQAGIVNANIGSLSSYDEWNDVYYSLRFMPTSTNYNTFIAGGSFRMGVDMRVWFRSVNGGSSNSIEVYLGGIRYRLFDKQLTALYNDFVDCGFIDFQVGKVDEQNQFFGFCFKTENVVVSYLSDGSGTFGNATLFNAGISSPTSPMYLTLDEVFIVDTDISADGSGINYYIQADYSNDEDCTYVNATDTAEWFTTAYYDLGNNFVDDEAFS